MKKIVLSAAVVLGLGVPLALWGRAVMSGTQEARRGDRVTVARRDIGTFVKATGIVRPTVGAEVRVGSRASGIVERLYVRIGDHVDKGHLLAQLETRELTARRDQAAASLSSARANLAFSATEVSRKRALARQSAVPQSDLELAERSLALAEAGVAEAEATLALARTQLDYARLVAPISGVVASVTTQEGETVSANLAAPTFVTIIDLSRLEVWAYVDETDIGRIRVGQQVTFTVDAYPDQPFAGEVTAVYPKAEIRDNVVNYVAVVTVARPQPDLLRPEMTASVKIALDLRANVLAVPRQAIRREQGRTYVMVDEGGAMSARQVTLGARDERFCEVTSGLREGESVLPAERAEP